MEAIVKLLSILAVLWLLGLAFSIMLGQVGLLPGGKKYAQVLKNKVESFVIRILKLPFMCIGWCCKKRPKTTVIALFVFGLAIVIEFVIYYH